MPASRISDGREAGAPSHKAVIGDRCRRVRQRSAITEAREARPGPDAGFMPQRPEEGRRAVA